MSSRVKIIIAIFILAIAVLAGFLIWKGSKSASVVTPSANVAPANVGAPSTYQTMISPGTGEINIEQFARAFAERYGSYSNQSNFENIKDLYGFMTEEMRSREQRARSGAEGETYLGVTTRAISSKIISQSGSSAVIDVITQRKEEGGRLAETRLYYQNIEISLVNAQGGWKANAAEWK